MRRFKCACCCESRDVASRDGGEPGGSKGVCGGGGVEESAIASRRAMTLESRCAPSCDRAAIGPNLPGEHRFFTSRPITHLRLSTSTFITMTIRPLPGMYDALIHHGTVGALNLVRRNSQRTVTYASRCGKNPDSPDALCSWKSSCPRH